MKHLTRTAASLLVVGVCSTAAASPVGIRGGLTLLAPDRVPYGLLGGGAFVAGEIGVTERLWIGADLQIFGAMCAGDTGDTCGIGAVYIGHLTARLAVLEEALSLDLHAAIGGLFEPIEDSPDGWAPHLRVAAEGGWRSRRGHLVFAVLGVNTTAVAVDAFQLKPFAGIHLSFNVWRERDFRSGVPDTTLAIVLRGNVALESYPALGGEIGLAYAF